MGSRIETVAASPEPSRVDGIEDGYSRASYRGWCQGRWRRWLPSLQRMGSTIAATVVAPEVSTEVVDDGGCNGGGRRQWWRERGSGKRRGKGAQPPIFSLPGQPLPLSKLSHLSYFPHSSPTRTCQGPATSFFPTNRLPVLTTCSTECRDG
uniref:Uncharacterized protein n=1 Tax=Oryza punctata TaxID=4537 RepID=A0A0E0JYI7_ORYPU